MARRAVRDGEIPVRTRLALRPEQLRRRADPALLGAPPSTAEVEPLSGMIGQPRALDAIGFALDVETAGYNLFVAGAPGSGRATAVRDALDRVAATRPAPDAWVYVHDFHEAARPNAIRLPVGGGRALAHDLDELVRSARREIPRTFESDEYDARRRSLLADVQRRRDRLADDLKAFARERGFAVEITPVGVATTPVVNGRPLTTELFEALPATERDRIEHVAGEVSERNASFVRELHRLEKEAVEQVRGLEREVALFALGPLFAELREKYESQAEVVDHLQSVEDDMVSHLDDFREEQGGAALPFALAGAHRDPFSRYKVNVLVDNGSTPGAPVVFEGNPTYYNLIGSIEYRPAFGSMETDFREIKAGALHRANGGFLVLEAVDLLREPFAWEALKRALRGGEVRIENLGAQYSAVPSATLRPEPVPLAVKVVLIGPPSLHRLLTSLDDDFRELFKVKAEFAPDMDWTAENEQGYARFVSRWVRDAGLRHFDGSAVARLVEHGGRLRDSQRKLTTRLIDVSDVVSEASYWAGEAGREIVTAADVDRAVSERERRSNLVEERLGELIEEGTIRIATDGEAVGQVNGLAILSLGDYAFGKPSRVTARCSLGRGGPLSIEREIDLSGPIHSKGFLILSGYLAGRYAQEQSLSFAATITFEQSYDEIDGDSASSTELYALLSELAEVPLDQGVAVTGSVDQHGNVQAVGGVTRKVEGFFETCRGRGLTGRQGVIVPAANVPDLMLRDEVVDAVAAGAFQVWAVASVDEGIEILSGLPAAEVHARAGARVRAYAERSRDEKKEDES